MGVRIRPHDTGQNSTFHGKDGEARRMRDSSRSRCRGPCACIACVGAERNGRDVTGQRGSAGHVLVIVDSCCNAPRVRNPSASRNVLFPNVACSVRYLRPSPLVSSSCHRLDDRTIGRRPCLGIHKKFSSLLDRRFRDPDRLRVLRGGLGTTEQACVHRIHDELVAVRRVVWHAVVFVGMPGQRNTRRSARVSRPRRRGDRRSPLILGDLRSA